MKTVNIPLGESPESLIPAGPHGSKSEKYYPTLHIERDEPLKLPDKGQLLVTFREVGKTETKDRSGKEHYSCRLEVLSIDGIKGDDMGDKESITPGENFDVVMEAYLKSKKGGKD